MAEVQHSVVTEVHLTLSGAEASVLRSILGSLSGGVTPDGYRAERVFVNDLYRKLNVPGVDDCDGLIAQGAHMND